MMTFSSATKSVFAADEACAILAHRVVAGDT
jgi:hypothetical protein